MWGQAVVIENKPGGQSTIGALAAARAPADGYTFYFATTAALVTNVYLFKQLSYDPQKEFVPVGFVARSPFAILVNAESPVNSDPGADRPVEGQAGAFSIGNEGPRTFGGMIARMFNSRAKAEANLVSYASTGVSAQDLIGGHVDAIVADVASTAALVSRAACGCWRRRPPRASPASTTCRRSSRPFPGLEMVGWFAVVAPTGTPQPAIDRFNKDLSTVLAERDIAERMAVIGPIPEPGLNVERVAAFLRAEHARWSQFTKEIGVLPE